MLLVEPSGVARSRGAVGGSPLGTVLGLKTQDVPLGRGVLPEQGRRRGDTPPQGYE